MDETLSGNGVNPVEPVSEIHGILATAVLGASPVHPFYWRLILQEGGMGIYESFRSSPRKLASRDLTALSKLNLCRPYFW